MAETDYAASIGCTLPKYLVARSIKSLSTISLSPQGGYPSLEHGVPEEYLRVQGDPVVHFLTRELSLAMSPGMRPLGKILCLDHGFVGSPEHLPRNPHICPLLILHQGVVELGERGEDEPIRLVYSGYEQVAPALRVSIRHKYFVRPENAPQVVADRAIF